MEETEWLVELPDSPPFILKFVGSTAEYIQIKLLEYSKEAALAFNFDISVLNNGPKVVTGRPTQTYAVSSSRSGRRDLSINSASSIDFESITTESDTQNSVDQNPDLIIVMFQVSELCLREDMNNAILDRYEFFSAICFVWWVTSWKHGKRESDVDTLATEL
ncbi:hypothetical protein PENFLA_c095G01341 [Penicillium flavigenum]|uniref:Uncharacterized protein n=1 Tax=Penicillium flavigenum TaxID=254877 RepID=A0A1V6S7Q0_9EURO|nr:hypothetical protein PENFLA_c095G01341 [Penicillium flavigenum]